MGLEQQPTGVSATELRDLLDASATELRALLDAMEGRLNARMDRLEQKVDQQGTVILGAIANLAVKVTRFDEKVTQLEENAKPAPSRKRGIAAAQGYSP